MIKSIRILLWQIVSELEQWLYPYHEEDRNDYYFKVKNPETGEEYMIIDWIKSHEEKLERLQDEMIWAKSEIHEIKNEGKN